MLKQDKVCGWCRKTDELVLMGQGGGVHTVCPECGSTGPYLSTNEVGKAYRELRARAEKAEKRLNTLRELCGYIEDGSDASVLIGQDDATKTWHICYSGNYQTIAWDESFLGMLDKAGEARAEREPK